MYAAAHILLTYTPRRAAKAGTVCAFRELCVLAEGNCSNHTQIKTSQYREQGYLNTGTEGWEEGWEDVVRVHAHIDTMMLWKPVCECMVLEGCCYGRMYRHAQKTLMHLPFKEMQVHGHSVFIYEQAWTITLTLYMACMT